MVHGILITMGYSRIQAYGQAAVPRLIRQRWPATLLVRQAKSRSSATGTGMERLRSEYLQMAASIWTPKGLEHGIRITSVFLPAPRSTLRNIRTMMRDTCSLPLTMQTIRPQSHMIRSAEKYRWWILIWAPGHTLITT